VYIKREVLERKFVAHLEWLTPNPDLFSDFREEVGAVWKQRQGDSQALYQKAQLRLSNQKTRKNTLIDLLIDGKINQPTFDEQLVRLDEEHARIMEDVRTSEDQYLDFDGLIDFADKIASRPARLWIESSMDQRQRLQKVFFPEA